MYAAPVVIIGLGEMGGVFARGLLKAGYPVYPVTRGVSLDEAAAAMPNPALVLVSVGEADLQAVLKDIPQIWRDRLGLLQNELLPHNWQDHVTETPTITSVWFEKKPGSSKKVVVPSPVFGPQAQILLDAYEALKVPAYLVEEESQLLFELVRKNLYILTSNIAGLQVGGTVSVLWAGHREAAESVARDVLSIQRYLTQQDLPEAALVQGMVAAFEGDPEHKCMGRSAPARLKRALAIADEAQLEVPYLRNIQAGLKN